MTGRLQRLLAVLQALGIGAAGWLLAARGWPVAGALAAATGLAASVHVAVIARHFAAACWGGAPVPPALRIGPLAATGMVLREALDSMRTFDWLQPFREHAPLPQPDRSTGVPVLLLHGYLCNRAVWRPFARFLADRGHPVEAITLEPAFGSIDAYATPVAQAVAALRRRTGAEQVAIVGHSMGGLALRAYLRAYGCAALAAGVTLGTPHAGTRLARWGVGTNARQMRHDSAWLQSLAASEDTALRARLTVVVTRHDNIVVPQAPQTLDGAGAIELSGVGHLSLAFDRRVMRLVARQLAALPAPRTA